MTLLEARQSHPKGVISSFWASCAMQQRLTRSVPRMVDWSPVLPLPQGMPFGGAPHLSLFAMMAAVPGCRLRTSVRPGLCLSGLRDGRGLRRRSTFLFMMGLPPMRWAQAAGTMKRQQALRLVHFDSAPKVCHCPCDLFATVLPRCGRCA